MHRQILVLVFASCKTNIHHIPVNKGRFKSQALLNEQAVLACMAYVDLNPVRAGLCDSLPDSKFTSVQQRIASIEQQPVQTVVKLSEFIGSKNQNTGIPFSLTDSLALTDWTGRCVHPEKKGHISATTPKILHQLGIDETIWLETVTSYQSKIPIYWRFINRWVSFNLL